MFQVDPTYVPFFTQRDFLYDLTDHFAGKVDGVLFPTDIAGSTYNGRMRTMPLWESTQLLFCNTDLLKKAGITAPSADPAARLTWDQLIELAVAAQKAGVEWGIAFEQVDRYYQLQVLPESLGGGPGVSGNDLLTVDVANDAWVRAGEWYGKLYSDGVASREADGSEDTRTLFREGKLAFFVGGPWNITNFNKSEGLNYSLAPHPYFEGGAPVTPSKSWHVGINSKSDNVELALQYLEFVGLNVDGSVIAAEPSGMLPANIAAAEISLANIPKVNPSLVGSDLLVRYELANTAIRRPRTLGYLQLEELVTRAWSDIRTGGNAATVLGGIQAELTRTFQRIER